MATCNSDVESLQKRLQVSEEWNMRSQAQIQELLRLSHSEIEAMRDRMHNPDIAIPLLQCYDAAILEKQEEVDKLTQELCKVRIKLESTENELKERNEAFRIAERKMKESQMQLQEERDSLEEEKLKLEREGAQTQRELSFVHDMEAALKREVEQLKEQLNRTQSGMLEYKQTVAALEETKKATQGRLKMMSSEREETQQQSEVQRIQLQLLSKENDDKLQELERLRHRMIQALRQAADNHAAHLRVVEEKHRDVVESLRAQLNTQEVETQKLRAQLARAEMMGKNNRYGMPVRTTTELLETQARQAQEIELKRLYGEISALQLQRDDAVLRYEKLSNSLRREESERVADAQREAQALRQRLREHEQRCEQLEQELCRAREELRAQREKCKAQAGELQRGRQEWDQSLRRVEEMRRAATAAEESCEQLRLQAKEDVARERQRVRELEQRVDEVLRDMQASGDRASAATAAVERERDELHKQLASIKERRSALEAQLSERDGEVGVLTAKVKHLQDAVKLNQQQVLSCEERLQQQLALDEKKSRELRELTLVVERLKRENARVIRERDRLIDEANNSFY